MREHYGEVARTEGGCGCGTGCCGSGEELAALPKGADMGLGCGTPLAFAALQPGEVVLDLGSGGGIDCFLAAKQVGDSGRVIGVDMTPEMLSKARPGGRLAISDIVASAPLPREISDDPAALAACIAGAPAIEDLRSQLQAAGFAGIHVAINESSRSEHFVASAAIRAIRPSGEGCCGSAPRASSCC